MATTPKKYQAPAEVRRLKRAIVRLKGLRTISTGHGLKADREAIACGIEHIEARLIDMLGQDSER